MRRTRRGAAFALVAGMLLAGVGCSANTTTTTSPTTSAEASSGTRAPTTGATTGTTESGTGASRPPQPTTTTAGGPGTTEGTGTGTGTDPESEFCVQITKANDAQKATKPNSTPTKAEIETFLGYLDDARAAAPDDAKEPLATLIAAYKAYEDVLDAPNPEGAALNILATEANLAAITNLSIVVKKVCGFQLSGTGTGSGSGSGSPTGSGPGSETGFDCSTITGFSQEAEKPTSIASVKRSLCEEDNEVPWLKAVLSGATWSVNGDTDWAITVHTDDNHKPLSAADALTLCQRISKYLVTTGMTDAKITVSAAPGNNATDATTIVLATQPVGGSCAAP